jgi:hypothetical protein
VTEGSIGWWTVNDGNLAVDDLARSVIPDQARIPGTGVKESIFHFETRDPIPYPTLDTARK